MFPPERFNALWAIHPEAYHEVRIGGKFVRTPRWQQAYGSDYEFAGAVNRALPVPSMLDPLVDWCREVIDPRFNGLLINWYDSEKGHYIGPHRDSVKNRIEGSPIVTISLGEQRIFRVRPWRNASRMRLDLVARDGLVFVLPWGTNLSFTHEIVREDCHVGQRISVTLRCFCFSPHPRPRAVATK